MKNDFGSHCAVFVSGLLVGGAIALLAAPQSGKRTRKTAQRKIEEGTDRLAAAADDLRERGQKVIKATMEQAGDRLKAIGR
jgi:gas vesicle protein